MEEEFKIHNLENEEKKFISITATKFMNITELKPLFVEENSVIKLQSATINRPGLLFAGMENYFAESRIQVLGRAEITYLENHDLDMRIRMLETLFSKKVPCIILARGIEPTDYIIDLSKKYSVPLFGSDKITSLLIIDLMQTLEVLLANDVTAYGVFVDVYGVGILITGESGIGKSETALELVHRGHRLVADDAVVIKRIRERLVGSSPPIIRNLMELRGLGIIDVSRLYGSASVLNETQLEYIINLEKWDNRKQYKRITIGEEFEEFMGIKVPKSVVPVMPGRNLAIIIEVAARNFRLKYEGIDAVNEIVRNIENQKKISDNN